MARLIRGRCGVFLMRIVHLAAPSLDRSDPIGGLWANTRVLLNAFHAAREWAVPRISFASTVGAYLGVEQTPFREDVPVPMTTVDPIPVFKKSAELFASLVDASGDLEVVSLRLSTVWGPL